MRVIKMKFYHYNTEEFDALLSIAIRGKGNIGDNPRAYNRNISLFLEPLPLNVAEIFNNTHSFYRSGLTLVEHVVDSNAIPLDILYSLTESPEKVALLYGSQKWYEGMPDELIASNKKEIKDMEEAKGYIGQGRMNMIKACRSVPKGIEKYFRKAAKLNEKFPEDKINEKYAACVPHLMIYPEGKINVQSTKSITLV